jgi:hypothetical protein
VTPSHELRAQKVGFAEIKKSIPNDIIKQREWGHVFIADDHVKAEYLRSHTLFLYSAVLDVGRRDITHAHLVAFDEKKVSTKWVLDARLVLTVLGDNQ